MSDKLKEIRERHNDIEWNYTLPNEGAEKLLEIAIESHADRGYLLERIEELEAQLADEKEARKQDQLRINPQIENLLKSKGILEAELKTVAALHKVCVQQRGAEIKRTNTAEAQLNKVREYTSHKYGCPKTIAAKYECDCGLDELLEQDDG